MKPATSTRIISKSSFICGDYCPYATLNCLTREKDASIPDLKYIFDNGTAVGVFARNLFPSAVVVSHKSMPEMAEETEKLIDAKTHYICEASFLKDDLFCAVDILKLTRPGHVQIIEVKSATEIKNIFYRDIAFQVYVVQQCGYKVDAAYLFYVNSEYVRSNNVDVKQYFKIENVSSDVFNLQSTIEDELLLIREALNKNYEPKSPISECCFKPYQCPFWEKICKSTLPPKSIFEIYGGMRVSTKLNLFNSGTRTMSDFLMLKKQNPKYVQQCRLECNEDNRTEVKMEQLHEFLDKITYPIISLDFECLNEAIQLFQGQKPYEQTVFQFSMHILWEHGEKLEHFEYLANPKVDWRAAVAHALARFCPTEGTVLVWNQAMEKNRILEMAEFEHNRDIRERLINIADRILDQMVPFRERVMYNRRMRGSYSLKKVLPALCPDDPNLSYADLSINNGMLASMAFSSLVHNNDMSAFQSAAIKRDLLTYCELDTYAPFCILEVMYNTAYPGGKTLFKKVERLDNTHKTIRINDRVSTNIGNGTISGFTKCFVKIRLDAGYNIIRMPHNLYNISGLDVPKEKHQDIPFMEGETAKFYDVTNREVKLGDFVITHSQLGEVVGRTKTYLRIKLSDGKEVLRHGTFVIVDK